MRDFSVPESVATPATPPTLAAQAKFRDACRRTVSFCSLNIGNRTRSYIAMRLVRQTIFYFIKAQKTCYPRNELYKSDKGSVAMLH
jgi:hypothetical protein